MRRSGPARPPSRDHLGTPRSPLRTGRRRLETAGAHAGTPRRGPGRGFVCRHAARRPGHAATRSGPPSVALRAADFRPGTRLSRSGTAKRVPGRLVSRDGFWLLWDAGRPFRARPHPFQTARRSGMAKSRAGTPAVASRNARNPFQNASRPETLESRFRNASRPETPESRSGTPRVPKRAPAF